MRLLVARCTVEYRGRLGARLALGTRLIVLKADGSLAIHSDSGAYKPLNWMSPPCRIAETADRDRRDEPEGRGAAGRARTRCSATSRIELGTDPGLEKDGVEAELQELIAARVEALKEGYRLIRREYPTDIGPVDLLCSDADGRTVVVEVKRIGEIAGVEQLLRYQERLDRDSRFAPTLGVFVAERIKPQARVFAESKGVACVEIDLVALRDGVDHMTLF